MKKSQYKEIIAHLLEKVEELTVEKENNQQWYDDYYNLEHKYHDKLDHLEQLEAKNKMLEKMLEDSRNHAEQLMSWEGPAAIARDDLKKLMDHDHMASLSAVEAIKFIRKVSNIYLKEAKELYEESVQGRVSKIQALEEDLKLARAWPAGFKQS